MHILITGGAGFIGSHTVEQLLDLEIPVRVLDDFSSGSRQNLPAHSLLDIQEGDIREAKALHRAMEGITHILHLAAQVSVQASVEDPVHSCSSNIQGFVNVLQMARTFRVERVVYASSAAVYGNPQRLPLSEEDGGTPLSPYGLEKSVNDQYAALFGQEFGLSLLGLRYFNVYGPRQDPDSPYAGVISKFLGMIEQHRPVTVFGDGAQTRDFIFVKDVAMANVRALQHTMTGVCNVATGRSVSLLGMIEVLSSCVGRPLEIVHQGAQAGDVPFSAANVDRFRSLVDIQRLTNLSDGLSQLIEETIKVQQRV